MALDALTRPIRNTETPKEAEKSGRAICIPPNPTLLKKKLAKRGNSRRMKEPKETIPYPGG